MKKTEIISNFRQGEFFSKYSKILLNFYLRYPKNGEFDSNIFKNSLKTLNTWKCLNKSSKFIGNLENHQLEGQIFKVGCAGYD